MSCCRLLLRLIATLSALLLLILFFSHVESSSQICEVDGKIFESLFDDGFFAIHIYRLDPNKTEDPIRTLYYQEHEMSARTSWFYSMRNDTQDVVLSHYSEAISNVTDRRIILSRHAHVVWQCMQQKKQVYWCVLRNRYRAIMMWLFFSLILVCQVIMLAFL